MSEIRLGNRVKHSITGYTGIAICKAEWLNGCVRFTVQAEEMHDAKPVAPQNFDKEELDYVDEGHTARFEETRATKPPAGPRADPQRFTESER